MFFKKNCQKFVNIFFLIFLSSLALSGDLISFVISWVGLNTSMYGLFTFGKNPFKTETTLKYFLSGGVVTIFLFLSVVLAYISFLTFSYDSYSFILNTYSNRPIIEFLFSTILLALLFKLGSFPFHFYLGDIYEGLDYRKSLFLYTVTLKVIIFIVIIKVLTYFIGYCTITSLIVLLSGVGSLSVSSISLLVQKKLKRFWAYSYLNTVGMSLIAISSSLYYHDLALSFISTKIYFIVYIVTWICIYFSISKLQNFNISKNNNQIIYISDLSKIDNFLLSYAKSKKTTFLINITLYKLLLFVSILSLMGLPPTFGFITKTYLFSSILASKIGSVFFMYTLILTPISGLAYIKPLIHLVKINWNDTSKLLSRFGLRTYSSKFLLSYINSFYTLSFLLSFIFVPLILISFMFFFFIIERIAVVDLNVRLEFLNTVFFVESLQNEFSSGSKSQFGLIFESWNTRHFKFFSNKFKYSYNWEVNNLFSWYFVIFTKYWIIERLIGCITQGHFKTLEMNLFY